MKLGPVRVESFVNSLQLIYVEPLSGSQYKVISMYDFNCINQDVRVVMSICSKMLVKFVALGKAQRFHDCLNMLPSTVLERLYSFSNILQSALPAFNNVEDPLIFAGYVLGYQKRFSSCTAGEFESVF